MPVTGHEFVAERHVPLDHLLDRHLHGDVRVADAGHARHELVDRRHADQRHAKARPVRDLGGREREQELQEVLGALARANRRAPIAHLAFVSEVGRHDNVQGGTGDGVRVSSRLGVALRRADCLGRVQRARDAGVAAGFRVGLALHRAVNAHVAVGAPTACGLEADLAVGGLGCDLRGFRHAVVLVFESAAGVRNSKRPAWAVVGGGWWVVGGGWWVVGGGWWVVLRRAHSFGRKVCGLHALGHNSKVWVCGDNLRVRGSE